MSFEPPDVSYLKKLIKHNIVHVILDTFKESYKLNQYIYYFLLDSDVELHIHGSKRKCICKKALNILTLRYNNVSDIICEHYADVVDDKKSCGIKVRDLVNFLLTHGHILRYSFNTCVCKACKKLLQLQFPRMMLYSHLIFQPLIEYEHLRHGSVQHIFKKYYISGCCIEKEYMFKRSFIIIVDNNRYVDTTTYYTAKGCDIIRHHVDGPSGTVKVTYGIMTDCVFYIRNKQIL